MQTILIIEDTMELRENTAELLELAGFRVITASDGHEGLLQTICYKPDLILCDLVMPKVGGMDLLKNKKKNKSICNIPLVFLSAGSASYHTGCEYKADAYLSKPFTYEQLLKIVHQLLNLN